MTKESKDYADQPGWDKMTKTWDGLKVAHPGLGSGALREALGRAASERHLAWGANGNPTCESYSFVACPYMPCKRDRELAALSLSSPIEPSCVRMEQPLGRLREIASGAVSASVAKQIRECVNQIVDLRLYGEAQASSEIREALRVLKAALKQTGCDGDLCLYEWHDDARRIIAQLEEQQ